MHAPIHTQSSRAHTEMPKRKTGHAINDEWRPWQASLRDLGKIWGGINKKVAARGLYGRRTAGC